MSGDTADARFRGLFESAPIGLAIVGLDLRFIAANPALCRLLGRSEPELRELTALEVTHPDDQEPSVAWHRRLLDGEVDAYTFEKRYVRPDGESVWARVSVSLIRDRHGEPTHTATTVIDLSEVRAAEAEAREAAARVTTTLESITDAFFTLDLDWCFTYVNRRAEELLQRDREELIGRNIWEELPAAVGGPFQEAYERALREGVTVVLEDAYYPEPLDTHFEVHAYPSSQGLAVYFRDVTDQLEALWALEEREAELARQAELLDQARDAIIVHDLDHRITYWNAGAERVYGWRRDEALGAAGADLLFDDPAEFEDAAAATLTHGAWAGEPTQRRRDGQEIVVEARWSLLRSDDGAPTGIMAINTDVTERKRLEQQFLRAQRMESLGTLAGGIAHDLNNVLSPIMMSVELLQLEEADPQRREILETVRGATQRGADLVEQVLSFARGVEGRQLDVDVAALLEEVAGILRETLPRGIALRIDAAEGLWPLVGDPTQLQQVLVNLSVNARDAMPDGGRLTIAAGNVRVDEAYARLTRDAEPGPHVVIRVEDSGVGMDAATLDKAFEPFFTTKSSGHGTGLGLSTSAAIVRSHGGFMQVYSEPARGTTFKVYLPAGGEAAAEAAGWAAASQGLPRGQGELVLVIDDEASVRQITAQTLEAFGYRVVVAADGAEAVSIFAERRGEIEAVLTDMMMPVMDGPKTMRALLRLDPDARIIAASGLQADGGVAKAADAGVRHFLPKPYTTSTLLTKLREVIDGVDPRGEPPTT